jgi:heme exporter protein A
MPAAFALAAHDLACRRGDAVLFAGLGFSVESGGALWIKGANGTGKTSLLRIAAGLAHAAAGGVQWCGQPIRTLGAAYRASVIYLGHTVPLKDDLSVRENLTEMLAFDGLAPRAATLDHALSEVGLFARRTLATRHLSLGQKRRLLMARLSLARRPLWLLDEPATGLDSEAVGQFETIVSHHLGAGGILVFTSHQPFLLDAVVTSLELR